MDAVQEAVEKPSHLGLCLVNALKKDASLLLCQYAMCSSKCSLLKRPNMPVYHHQHECAQHTSASGHDEQEKNLDVITICLLLLVAYQLPQKLNGLTTKYNHRTFAALNPLTESEQCRVCYLIVLSGQSA